ncbi:DNA-3-methyladenine glycosylase I [Pelistega ratti]|uniref:DNA-3-methyladenine glycosylase I n=1 Tax=Pelistega ratti TaxID=2652177 RepID=UPI001357DEA3|nr:DNA-3-methyladenine glycosylase I [Pelistega ratti]
MSYCDFANALPDDTDNPNKHYHDHLYGFPVENDNALFGRLLLEINQAGLSWTTILKKEKAFFHAYAEYDIKKVANFSQEDINRLLNDTGIIRNRLKIQAAIFNAQQILLLQKEFGSFKAWLDTHHPLQLPEWVKLFKKHFKFVGGEIVNEFLMSTGYLEGAHTPDCPQYQKVINCSPPWLNQDSV